MNKLLYLAVAAGLIGWNSAEAKRVKLNYSVIDVPEEGGVKFEQITEDSDCVNKEGLVSKAKGMFGIKNLSKIDWWVNPRIAVSPDGSKVAYLNWKNRTSNVMVKDAHRGGASTQRTFRANVTDFTWSPDGNTICLPNSAPVISACTLLTPARGTVVRQISTGNENDFAGQITADGNTFFSTAVKAREHTASGATTAKRICFQIIRAA